MRVIARLSDKRSSFIWHLAICKRPKDAVCCLFSLKRPQIGSYLSLITCWSRGSGGGGGCEWRLVAKLWCGGPLSPPLTPIQSRCRTLSADTGPHSNTPTLGPFAAAQFSVLSMELASPRLSSVMECACCLLF